MVTNATGGPSPLPITEYSLLFAASCLIVMYLTYGGFEIRTRVQMEPTAKMKSSVFHVRITVTCPETSRVPYVRLKLNPFCLFNMASICFVMLFQACIPLF
jgi:hypothetical protein